MLDYTLSADKLTELRAPHRGTKDEREADRIKAVVLLATSWRAEDVAEVLQVDPNTVRNHFKERKGPQQVSSRVIALLSVLCDRQLQGGR
ncbi:MAG: helix-turn-helix domain-containing protein [Chromatiaceae bacterium]|nr:helix-turn-helix domain-containing protein [Chromatiaceae bacterium]